MRTNSVEDIQRYKKASNTPDEVEEYFPGFSVFHRFHRTADTITT